MPKSDTAASVGGRRYQSYHLFSPAIVTNLKPPCSFCCLCYKFYNLGIHIFIACSAELEIQLSEVAYYYLLLLNYHRFIGSFGGGKTKFARILGSRP